MDLYHAVFPCINDNRCVSGTHTKIVKDSSAEKCLQFCSETSGCTSWGLAKWSDSCYLFKVTDVNYMIESRIDNCVSGPKNCEG